MLKDECRMEVWVYQGSNRDGLSTARMDGVCSKAITNRGLDRGWLHAYRVRSWLLCIVQACPRQWEGWLKRIWWLVSFICLFVYLLSSLLLLYCLEVPEKGTWATVSQTHRNLKTLKSTPGTPSGQIHTGGPWGNFLDRSPLVTLTKWRTPWWDSVGGATHW